MIMPATMGIGLAVGGCAKENAIPVYSAPLQDSSPPGQTDVLLGSDTQPGAPDNAVPGPDSSAPGKEVAPDTVRSPSWRTLLPTGSGETCRSTAST